MIQDQQDLARLPLWHYSAEGVKLEDLKFAPADREWYNVKPEDGGGKAFWCSYEEGGNGWETWCREMWRTDPWFRQDKAFLDKLAHRQRVTLRPSPSTRLIASEDEIQRFDTEFGWPTGKRTEPLEEFDGLTLNLDGLIHWHAVQEAHDAVAFIPYPVPCRDCPEFWWYTTIDCDWVVIFRSSAIASMGPPEKVVGSG